MREYESKMLNISKEQIDKIKRDKKNIEKEYDKLEERCMRAEMELEKVNNILKEFKSLFN